MTRDIAARERLRWLRRNARRWLLALSLLSVAVLVGSVWSLGVFTSTSANPENLVSAGTMTQSSTADNAAFLSATDMAPGSSVQGKVTIGNVGDARGDFTLAVEDVADEPGPDGGRLSERLRLKVIDTEARKKIFTGPLTALDIALGTWVPGEERTYKFCVWFPNRARGRDNAYQEASVTATFAWHAVQSP